MAKNYLGLRLELYTKLIERIQGKPNFADFMLARKEDIPKRGIKASEGIKVREAGKGRGRSLSQLILGDS